MNPTRQRIMPTILPRWILAGVPLYLFGSCSASDVEIAASTTVRDSAGVELVENGEVGAWGPAAARLDTVLRIGVEDGDPRYLFHEVSKVLLDDSGGVYVGQRLTATVRMYRPDGTWRGEFGGQGGGPGEFRSLNQMVWAGDQVGVIDWSRGGKAGVFDRNGELVDNWSFRRADGLTVMPLGYGGGWWIGEKLSGGPFPSLSPGEEWRQPRQIVRIEPESDSVDGWAGHVPPRVLYGSTVVHGIDWALFSAQPMVGADAGGRVFSSHGYPYLIDVFDPDGRMVRRVTRDVPPRELTEADVIDFKDQIERHYDTVTRGDPIAQKRQNHDRIDQQATVMPDYLPPLRRLLVAPSGAFWVERTDLMTPGDYEYGRLFGYRGRWQSMTPRWDVFDSDGRFVAEVELPPRYNAMFVTDTTVAGVLRDELDVEYVVVYRVGPGG